MSKISTILRFIKRNNVRNIINPACRNPAHSSTKICEHFVDPKLSSEILEEDNENVNVSFKNNVNSTGKLT